MRYDQLWYVELGLDFHPVSCSPGLTDCACQCEERRWERARWNQGRPDGPPLVHLGLAGRQPGRLVFVVFHLTTFSKLDCLDFVWVHFLNLSTMPTSISLDHNRLSCRCTCFRSQKEEKTKTVVQVTSWFWISDCTNLPPEQTLEVGGLPRAGLALWPGNARPRTPWPRLSDPQSGSRMMMLTKNPLSKIKKFKPPGSLTNRRRRQRRSVEERENAGKGWDLR